MLCYNMKLILQKSRELIFVESLQRLKFALNFACFDRLYYNSMNN